MTICNLFLFVQGETDPGHFEGNKPTKIPLTAKAVFPPLSSKNYNRVFPTVVSPFLIIFVYRARLLLCRKKWAAIHCKTDRQNGDLGLSSAVFPSWPTLQALCRSPGGIDQSEPEKPPLLPETEPGPAEPFILHLLLDSFWPNFFPNFPFPSSSPQTRQLKVMI